MTMTKFSRINKQREEITMRVLEDMEKGGNEWKKPWVEASPLPPHNPVSGTQSARATGKDNIIQFAPRQNGKDIPSSKGTSLASKSQKYVAMANALNAASKSYVYRNEVAR